MREGAASGHPATLRHDDNRVTRIAFFAHDAADAAVRRRVQGFRHDGFDVTGFMMRRHGAQTSDWENIDLGETRDGAFFQRIRRVFAGARLAAAHRARLAQASVIYARNLDMLACAFLAKHYTKLSTPVIYECLDVHRLLTRQDPVGAAMRRLEHQLLRQSAGLVVSSPGFLRNHFERRYPGDFQAFLVENRLAPGGTCGERISEHKSRPSSVDEPLRLGWVGNLRCRRSFRLLCDLADRFPEGLEIHLHGVPARNEIPVFEPLIGTRPNLHFHGPFRSPEDLASIYGRLDVVWAGDFMDEGYNSTWLLPNRLYEGGYYCTPSIAPAGTETAAWLERQACGFIISNEVETSLPQLIAGLIEDRRQVASYAERLAAMAQDSFIQPQGLLAAIVNAALAGRSQPGQDGVLYRPGLAG
jgi:succinoglycan biosynthesis protein ExoL